MKRICWLCIVFMAGFVAFNLRADADPAGGDAAWAEIVRATKSSPKPSSAELAAKLKAFHTAYPNHPRAADAWVKEQALRSQTTAAVAPVTQPSFDTPAALFQAKLHDANLRIQNAKAAGTVPGLGEMERSGRKLASEFPNESAGWQMLLNAADGFGGEKAKQLYADIAAHASAELKTVAAERLRPKPVAIPAAQKFPGQGKSMVISFTAIDNRHVDVSQMAGKVILVDFWATWCGPCRAALPEVKQAYKELHDQGFEVIGISLDEDLGELKKIIASNDMPWPQFFDGNGWNNSIAKQFSITAIPATYLLDKHGHQRFADLRGSLSEKVRALLQEP
jgi:thiol-disulfide isomerase/thioredoxin